MTPVSHNNDYHKDRQLQGSAFGKAFRCDHDGNRLSPQEEQLPLKFGESIKICVKPTRYTLDKGILIRRISQFTFAKDETNGYSEDAILEGGKEAPGTLLKCQSGSTICMFRYVLSERFFTDKPGNVTGIGEIDFEFSDDLRRRSRSLREQYRQSLKHQQQPPYLRRSNSREVQARAENGDIKSAGSSVVEITFRVMGGGIPLIVEESVWQSVHLTWKYATYGSIAFVLLSCLFCIGICFGLFRCTKPNNRENNEKNIQDLMMATNNDDDNIPIREVDIDSQASFFKNLGKDMKTKEDDLEDTHSEEEYDSHQFHSSEYEQHRPQQQPQMMEKEWENNEMVVYEEEDDVEFMIQLEAPIDHAISSTNNMDGYDDEASGSQGRSLLKPSSWFSKLGVGTTSGQSKSKRGSSHGTSRSSCAISDSQNSTNIDAAVPSNSKKKKKNFKGNNKQKKNNKKKKASETKGKKKSKKKDSAPSPKTSALNAVEEDKNKLSNKKEQSRRLGATSSENPAATINTTISESGQSQPESPLAVTSSASQNKVRGGNYSQESLPPTFAAIKVNVEEWPSDDELSMEGNHHCPSSKSQMKSFNDDRTGRNTNDDDAGGDSDSEVSETYVLPTTGTVPVITATSKTNKKDEGRASRRYSDQSSESSFGASPASAAMTMTDDDDDDSVNFFPADRDIALNCSNHPGTMVYRMAVGVAVKSNKAGPFSSRVRRLVEKQLKGRTYYIQDKAGAHLSFWREATEDEVADCMKVSYEEEIRTCQSITVQ